MMLRLARYVNVTLCFFVNFVHLRFEKRIKFWVLFWIACELTVGFGF